MQQQREFLCIKHVFFPQYPKILNCYTNNALTQKNEGHCIHLINIHTSKIKCIIDIRERANNYIENKKYEREYGENSKLEKLVVLDVIEKKIEKLNTERLTKPTKPIKKKKRNKGVNPIIGLQHTLNQLEKWRKELMLMDISKKENRLIRNEKKIQKVKSQLEKLQQQ